MSANIGRAFAFESLLPLFHWLISIRATLDVILCAFDIAMAVGACGQVEFSKSPVENLSSFVSICRRGCRERKLIYAFSLGDLAVGYH